MADRRFIHQKNIDNALIMLKDTIDVLDELNIKYYLDFGTLLGAVRDKGFIPWDDDIDISLVDKKDYNKLPFVLKKIQNKNRYRTYLFNYETSLLNRKKRNEIIYNTNIFFTNPTNYHIAKIRTNKFLIFGRGNTQMDIFCKYEYDNKLYWMADGIFNQIDNKILKEGFKKILFYNIECFIPINYDEYLSSIYGKWQKKDKKWTESQSCSLVK